MLFPLVIFAVLSADPKAVVSGDDTVFVGQMATVSGLESENAVSYTWLVTPKPFSVEKFPKRAIKDSEGRVIAPSGSELRISHDEPETFNFTLVIAGADGKQDIDSWSLRVEAKAGKIPTANALPPQQRQLTADDVARMMDKMLAKQQADPADFDVTSWLDANMTTDDARRIANALLQEARYLEGLPTNEADVAKVVQDTAVLCKGSLTAAQWQAWLPWFGQLGEQFDALAAEGYLETADDYAAVLEEVSHQLKDFVAGG